MNTRTTLLSLCLIHLLAVAAPGPDFILVARNSLTGRLRAGLATAAGITLGNGAHILYSVLAAAYLSARHVALFEGMKVVGGAYLGWIGWKCIGALFRPVKSKSEGAELTVATGSEQEPPGKGAPTFRSAFGMGLMTTLLNAKAAIYFVSIVPQFIQPGQPTAKNLSAVALLLLITVGWFSFVAWITGLDAFRSTLLRHQARIEGVMGIVLLAYAGLIVGPALIGGAAFSGLFRGNPASSADFVRLESLEPSIIFDIRYAGSENFLGRPVRGYLAPACLLSRPAAEALSRAQAELRQVGLGLRVFDCFRPQRAVDDFVTWGGDLSDQKMKASYYPRVEKAEVFKLGYIAARSGHSRGSTVDLTIEGLDMGTPYDFFDENSHTESPRVSASVRANRLRLRGLMERHGFKNLPEEWWHYTLVGEPHPETYFDFDLRTGPEAH